jgi:hypothetical protein
VQLAVGILTAVTFSSAYSHLAFIERLLSASSPVFKAYLYCNASPNHVAYLHVQRCSSGVLKYACRVDPSRQSAVVGKSNNAFTLAGFKATSVVLNSLRPCQTSTVVVVGCFRKSGQR